MPPSSWNVNEFCEKSVENWASQLWSNTIFLPYTSSFIHHHSSFIVIISTIGGKRVDIQVGQGHEQECKDKWSTQLRKPLFYMCFESWKEYVWKNTFNVVIIFRRRANSFQLSRADHYTSWSDLSDPPRSRPAVMLWGERVSYSTNWLCGIWDWSCLSFDGN